MLTALILICSLTSVSDVSACTEDNALQVLRSPETFARPGKSFLRGIDPAGSRRRRNDDPISLTDHLDGLARIQITSDSAIGYISLSRT